MKKILIFLLLVSQFGQAQNLFARQNFAGGGVPTFNTYIGGISGSITSATQLGIKLGISNTRIQNFTIVGSDIKCKIIGGSYAMPASAFSGETNLTFFRDLDNLIISLNGSCFLGAVNLYELQIDGVVTITGSGNFQSTNLTTIILPNLTSTGATAFNDIALTSFKRTDIYIPNCTVLGATVNTNENVFLGIKNYSIIYANPTLATINSGGVEADLAYAITQGAVVRYKTNYTAPNPVTTLSSGSVFDTAIQVSFTPPSSTNAIDYYECYANGVFKNRITGSGQYITGLTTSSNYDITIVAVDVLLNKSIVSNTINQSTNTASFLEASTIAAYHLLTNGVDSKNAYNGTVGGAVTFSSGAVFNGTGTSNISIADNNDFSFTDGTNDKPFSISGYAKWSSNFYMIAKHNNNYNNTEEWAMMTQGGNINFLLEDKTTSTTILRFSIANPFNNTAYKHFVITYDGSRVFGGFKFYIDGVLQTITNASLGTYTGMKNGTLPVVFGAQSNFGNPFSGSLKEVNFFNRVLTQTEVTFLQTNNYPF